MARLQRVAWRSIAGFDLGAEDRKDAFAATFFRLNERLATIREPAKLPGWVATTARNEVHTLLRARRRLRPPTPRPAAGAGPRRRRRGLIDDELHGAVRPGFAALSARCQELLRLVTLDPPLSYAEVGDLLDMPHGSIGPTRQRCLDQLRGTPRCAPSSPGGRPHGRTFDDDRLLAVLAGVLDETDPVPADALAIARAADLRASTPSWRSWCSTRCSTTATHLARDDRRRGPLADLHRRGPHHRGRPDRRRPGGPGLPAGPPRSSPAGPPAPRRSGRVDDLGASAPRSAPAPCACGWWRRDRRHPGSPADVVGADADEGAGHRPLLGARGGLGQRPAALGRPAGGRRVPRA